MSPEVTRYILWNELDTAMNYLRYELHQRCMNCLLCKHCGVTESHLIGRCVEGAAPYIELCVGYGIYDVPII